MGSLESLRQTSTCLLSLVPCHHPHHPHHPQIQASTTSSPGCEDGLQGRPLCRLSQLSHLAKSSYTMLPKARASPSSEAILLSIEQSPNSLFRELQTSQTSLQSPLLSSEFPSPKELSGLFHRNHCKPVLSHQPQRKSHNAVGFCSYLACAERYTSGKDPRLADLYPCSMRLVSMGCGPQLG